MKITVLLVLLSMPLFGYCMEEWVDYFEMLPDEMTALIITQIPEPTSTLAQAAQSLAPLALTSKSLSITPRFLIQDYKKRKADVELFLSDHVWNFNTVLFDLPNKPTICCDAHALKTIVHRLQNKDTTIPKLFNEFKHYSTFDLSALKECLSTNKVEANVLLKEMYNCLASRYEHYCEPGCKPDSIVFNNKKIQYCDWIMINNEIIQHIIDNMVILLKAGANANATHDFLGDDIPLLHDVCIVGNAQLVKAFLDNGADINARTSLTDANAIEWMMVPVHRDNKNRIEILEELFSGGISLSTIYNDNRTILDLAYEVIDNEGLVSYLRSKGAKTYRELQGQDLI
ncbi:hypothetical protein Noda2021_09820 [Candidatus Dependentiae bacterium Noda2021]|nr:hypothetical protein Noda2021_09820 [Candidatus Dependentiae bacterium Noda2021]